MIRWSVTWSVAILSALVSTAAGQNQLHSPKPPQPADDSEELVTLPAELSSPAQYEIVKRLESAEERIQNLEAQLRARDETGAIQATGGHAESTTFLSLLGHDPEIGIIKEQTAPTLSLIHI